jgi:hypothetical protein
MLRLFFKKLFRYTVTLSSFIFYHSNNMVYLFKIFYKLDDTNEIVYSILFKLSSFSLLFQLLMIDNRNVFHKTD